MFEIINKDVRQGLVDNKPPRDNRGRFLKGYRYNTHTEFKPGTHRRWPKKPHWDYNWLYEEYVNKERSMREIAEECGVTENAVWFFVKKFAIPTRKMQEIRKKKHWGASGEDNPMYGKRGHLNPNYRGGNTPYRQHVYSRRDWRNLRRRVRYRDKGQCRLCGISGNLEMHHIVPVCKCPLLIADQNNVVMLCKKCHKRVGKNPNRWARRLFAIITERR